MRPSRVFLWFLLLSSASAGWFGDRDATATFQKDAAKTWQSGKEASSQKASQAKKAAKDSADKGKKAVQEATESAKKKGQQVTEEGKGLWGRIWGGGKNK